MRELVVIGNGMVGARAVEEILARGGGVMFRITMFGDEPHGNYNRILLSELLARGTDPDEDLLDADFLLNPRQWYGDNGITLHAGVRVVRIDRFAHRVYADDGSIVRYDKLVLATGSRPYFPPMEDLWADDKTLTPGVFGFRTLHDTMAMMRCPRQTARRSDRWWSTRVGGGPRAASAWFGGARRARCAGPDESAAGCSGRPGAAAVARTARHERAHRRPHHRSPV